MRDKNACHNFYQKSNCVKGIEIFVQTKPQIVYRPDFSKILAGIIKLKPILPYDRKQSSSNRIRSSFSSW